MEKDRKFCMEEEIVAVRTCRTTRAAGGVWTNGQILLITAWFLWKGMYSRRGHHSFVVWSFDLLCLGKPQFA